MPFGGKVNFNKQRLARITDVRNLVLYLFMLVVLAITWSGVKAVQNNYELQKKIDTLRQQNEILKLENENAAVQNKYLETEEYLELSARQNLGLAAPGETVLLIPEATALKYVDRKLIEQEKEQVQAEKSAGVAKNIDDWRNFLLGRKTFEN